MEDQEQNILKHFLKQLGHYGKHRKIVQLHGTETRPSDIIVGEIHSMADTAEKPNRKPLVTVLREVYPDGSKGKLFSLFAFNKYVHMLESNATATGSIIGICGADIDRCPIIDTNDDDHLPYRARLGLPKKKGSKFIFMVNCHSEGNETLTKMQRMNKAKETLVSSQTNQNLSGSSQITSKEGPNTSVAAAGASKSKPEQSTSKTGLKVSEVGKDLTPSVPSTSKALPSKSLSTSSATPSASTTPMKDIPERRQTQRPTETINRYQYLKLCDLKMAATKLNVYGVINRLLGKRHNYAHLDLVDETLSADQTFKLHIFKGSVSSLPNIKEGHIIRAHRLKTEKFQEQWDGRVFDARDVVIFPPEGNGKEGAETVSKKFHFDDTDLECLTVLRQWIKKEYSKRPLSSTPTSYEDSLSEEEQHIDGGYNSSVKTLAEIQSEGHYILYCKVVESHHKKGKTALLVTDGTIPSDLITREKASSADNRDGSAEVSRTVEVILKSETEMKLQDEFVKIGVEAETVVDAHSEKTCLAFVLWKIQSIKIIAPTHSEAKLIDRRLQQMEKDANCPVSTRIAGTSKRVPNDQEVQSDSNNRSGHDVSGSKDLSQNRKRRTNSQSQESKNSELERNIEKRRRVAESTGMQQRRRSLSSEDLSEIKQQHRWHDTQGHFHVTPSETEASRDTISETEVSVNTSTPVENSDESDIEEDGKCEDIISLLYNSPAKKNVPTNIQGCRLEHVDSTRWSPVLSRENKQSFLSNDCVTLYSSKQLQRASLVPRVNSKDGAKFLKILKQKAQRRVYGDNRANLDHGLNHSNDTINDDGIQTVPNEMQNEKSQAHECLECSALDSAEMMGNMDQCVSRVARVKPVTKDQENSQVKTSTDLEYAEEVQRFENSEERSPTETEHDQDFGVVNLDAMLSVSEQGDIRSDGDIALVTDDPETSPAGPSSYRGDLRERISQFQSSNNNVDSGTSDDEDSGTSRAYTYVPQNNSVLGQRVAESCSGGDVDRHCKYPKTSPENCIDQVQIVNDSDDQESALSESNASITSRWTEVQDGPNENPMPLSIRCIKSKTIQENEYLVEGVITQIEPPIRAGNSKDLVSGYCSACNTFSRYSSLILESNSQKRTCPHCPEGRRKVVLLLFALRLHIVDNTNEELVVGLYGESGMEFFGVTANRYLRDPQIRRQVTDALLNLLPANEVEREPRKVRLHIRSFLDLSGIQYMIQKTYLCYTHGRE